MDIENKIPDVVDLNVGGQMMTTLLSTLTKDTDSMLASMFSGRHVMSKDKDGRFFIDCDGHLFKHILNFLRFGSIPPKEKILEVYDIAMYFNIKLLVESLEKFHVIQYRKKIAELKTQTDLSRYEKLKQEAIEKIYSCCASSHAGKTLHLFSGSDVLTVPGSIMCRHGYTTSAFRCGGPINNKINIYLTTDGEITEELKLCLAHDLSELGFGIYSYVYDTATPLRNVCSCSFQCHHIALLAHKLVPVPDANYRVW